MKSKYHATKFRTQTVGASLVTAIVVCFGAPTSQAADNLWTGTTSTEWNDATNWSLGRVPEKTGFVDNAVININTGNIATIATSNLAKTPQDILVGLGAATNGRLDHQASDAYTGGGNWMVVGRNGGTGVYNLADTSVVDGGNITGFGQGSGTMNVGGELQVGSQAGGVGTINVNTLGSINVPWNLFIGRSDNGAGCSGTLNLVSGAFNGNSQFIIGEQSTGVVNMDGGTLFGGNEFWVGQGGNGNGTLTLNAGAITTTNWTVVGRGGSHGLLTMNGGTLTKTGGGAFIVGDQDNSTGAMILNGGDVNLNDQFWVASGGGSNKGTFTMNAGTFAVNAEIVIGRGGIGEFNMVGGTFTKTGGGNCLLGSSATTTIVHSGGVIDVQTGTTWISEWGICDYTLSGTGSFLANDIIVAQKGGSTGTANFDGGNLETSKLVGGPGTSTVNFNGTQILATAANTEFLAYFGTATIEAGGLLLDSNGFNLGAPQVFGGTGGIVKTGGGNLNLSGANSYAGTTTIDGGSVSITTASTATGAITLADATDLGVTQINTDEVFAGTDVTFGTTGDTTLDINLGDLDGNTLYAPLDFSGTATLNGVVTVNIADSWPFVGIIPLVSYVGPKSGTGSFALGTLPDGVQATLSDNGTGLVALDVTRVNDAYWTGAVDGEWETTKENWMDDLQEIASTYADGDPVMFDDRVTGLSDVILNTTVTPGGSGVTFAGDYVDYTLSGTGKITGTTGLQKENPGALAINTTNDYTGVTILSGGITSVATVTDGGVPSPLGAATNDAANLVFNGGTLDYTGATTTIDRGFTVTGDNSGISTVNDLTTTGVMDSTAGSLLKSGPGNFTVSNDGANFMGGGNSEITNGTLSLIGTGTQSVTVDGELWVGSTPDAGGHLVLQGTDLFVARWLTLGRINGTGNTSTITATDSAIECTNFSSGYDGDSGINDSDQIITLTNTTWVNNGATLLAERVDSTTHMTLAGTSAFSSPNQFQMALNGSAVANLTVQDDASVTLTGGWLSIGNDGTGIVTVKDNATFTKNGGDFNISDVGTSNGTLNIQGNATVTTNNQVFVGKNGGTTGTVNMDNGTFNAATWLSIGRQPGATGTFNMNGGILTQGPNGAIAVAEQGTGTLNVNGGRINITGDALYLTTEPTTTAVAVANLNGGTVTTKRVTERDDTSGSSTLNLNGGLLQAGPGANLDFMSNLDAANVMTGGAHIDSNGETIAISQPLLDGDALGGGLTKTGLGGLGLMGTNTYTGTTLVSAGALGGTGSVAGPLIVEASAAIAPGAAAVGTFTAGATTISGSYACEIDGSPADMLVANGTHDVSAASLDITELSPASGLTVIIASYTGATPAEFASTSGMPAGYSIDYNYLGGNQIALVGSATPYQLWASAKLLTAGVNDGPTQDPENDGIANALEFVLGGDPLASDPGILPTLDASGANLVFSFTRADESEAEISLLFQYGTDLAGWTDVVIGVDNAGSGPEVDIVENDAAPDDITVTIPKGANTELFGRLEALK
ncbi:MAG: autotransporter-associated beta strand repeat-containing protein [Akkermansiaceae bacterium]|nr:autotransporter-associated beta strand repeat-containing protein [Akkermansiaceae bacterium]